MAKFLKNRAKLQFTADLISDTLTACATSKSLLRMLRPAVITRKTNGCNSTDGSAKTHAILSSVLATCRQQAIPILDYLIKLQRYGDTSPALTAPQPAPT